MEASGAFDLHWKGPFAWPGTALQDVPDFFDDKDLAMQCGLYLWTVEHASGYLIYAAGITRRSFSKRFREHTRAYRSGVYTIFDVALLKCGVRHKVWPGFWFKKRSAHMQNEYRARTAEIRKAAEELLRNYRIFVAPLTPITRVLERTEAAIMNILYSARDPASVIPDRGMALAPRRRDEAPIRVQSISPVLLHGLPAEFEV